MLGITLRLLDAKQVLSLSLVLQPGTDGYLKCAYWSSQRPTRLGPSLVLSNDTGSADPSPLCWDLLGTL